MMIKLLLIMLNIFLIATKHQDRYDVLKENNEGY